MAEAIDKIAGIKSESFLGIAQEAYCFVTKERSWEVQSIKIYRFMIDNEK